MKISCNIIQDIIPLYNDNACSPESAELVEEHIKVCEYCRQELARINEDDIRIEVQMREVNITKTAFALWKRAKRKAYYKGLVIAVAVLLLIVAVFVLPYTKSGMKLTVNLMEKQLTQYAEDKLKENFDSESNIFGYRVTSYSQAGMVDFLHAHYSYEGFYYSKGGEPIGFQGTEAVFMKMGTGWIWREVGGDNWMYVEHIVGNWYWYEMHF